jgi:hypothetical protein
MHGGMTATTHPGDPLVIGLSVLYEDEPDGRVIAHIPQEEHDQGSAACNRATDVPVGHDIAPFFNRGPTLVHRP